MTQDPFIIARTVADVQLSILLSSTLLHPLCSQPPLHCRHRTHMAFNERVPVDGTAPAATGQAHTTKQPNRSCGKAAQHGLFPLHSMFKLTCMHHRQTQHMRYSSRLQHTNTSDGNTRTWQGRRGQVYGQGPVTLHTCGRHDACSCSRTTSVQTVLQDTVLLKTIIHNTPAYTEEQ